jgi:4-amino-4-deoxychorismate lyase
MCTQLCSGATASFALTNRIFLGEGLFETMRVEQQQPCYWRLHWERLRQAAIFLNIPFDVSIDTWHEQLTNTLSSSPSDTNGVKAILSSGDAARGLDAYANNASLAFQIFNDEPSYKPLDLITAPWLRDGRNPIHQVKSINYLNSILARRHALASGGDEALFFNLDQRVTETTIANVFIIKQDHLYTPALTEGVLAGITRGRLLHLCAQATIPCIEAVIAKDDLLTADAVFVTNALQGIRLVQSLDGMTISTHHDLISVLQGLLAFDEARLN